MNKHIDLYPRPKNRSTAAVAISGAALLGYLIVVSMGCAPKTAATVNRDVTTVIAGAGAAANQAETEYNSKTIAQTPAARNVINTLGEAYNQARNAFITVLNAESVYRGAEQLQLIACSPASVAPANPPAVNCPQTTQNAQNAAAQLQTANAALQSAVANLSNQTKAVQALK